MTDIIFILSNYGPLVITLLPIYLWYKNRKDEAVLAVISLAITFGLAESLKFIFNIPRPFGKGLTPSFPSSHTTVMFSFARSFKGYNILFVLGFLFATFVGIGRVYTGYHTWIDVIAGAVLGYGVTEIIFRYKSKFKFIKKLHKK